MSQVRALMLLVVPGAILLTSCLPSQLMGEGHPPGYVAGNIPVAYSGLNPPFALTDSQAVTAGESVYRANCASCHGDHGLGDGPRAPYLEPRPANFASPAMQDASQKRPDYLFWRVSDGVPQTGMPSWKDQLSETQRWQVIAYIRYLGEQARSGGPAAGSTRARSYRP